MEQGFISSCEAERGAIGSFQSFMLKVRPEAGAREWVGVGSGVRSECGFEKGLMGRMAVREGAGGVADRSGSAGPPKHVRSFVDAEIFSHP